MIHLEYLQTARMLKTLMKDSLDSNPKIVKNADVFPARRVFSSNTFNNCMSP